MLKKRFLTGVSIIAFRLIKIKPIHSKLLVKCVCENLSENEGVVRLNNIYI